MISLPEAQSEVQTDFPRLRRCLLALGGESPAQWKSRMVNNSQTWTRPRAELCLLSCPDKIFQNREVLWILSTSFKASRRCSRVRNTFKHEAAGTVHKAEQSHIPTLLLPQELLRKPQQTGVSRHPGNGMWAGNRWGFFLPEIVVFPWSHTPLTASSHPVPHPTLPQQSTALSEQGLCLSCSVYWKHLFFDSWGVAVLAVAY